MADRAVSNGLHCTWKVPRTGLEERNITMATSLLQNCQSVRTTSTVCSTTREFCPKMSETVFALGQTKPAKEFSAVAHTPRGRGPRGLGIHCMPDTATAMIPARKAVLQSLLTTLLRRFLTPSHQKMNIPHDDWFRDVVLPIVADSDARLGHSLRNGLCCRQWQTGFEYSRFFWCRKKQAAAILIAGLLALDPERRLRYQLICKENTGTKSFVDVLIYLKLPAEVFKRVGRLISDGEASKPEQSTSKDYRILCGKRECDGRYTHQRPYISLAEVGGVAAQLGICRRRRSTTVWYRSGSLANRNAGLEMLNKRQVA